MTAKQRGRIWKWIQNNLEIYMNLKGTIDTSPVQKSQICPTVHFTNLIVGNSFLDLPDCLPKAKGHDTVRSTVQFTYLVVGNCFGFASLFAKGHDRVGVRLAQKVILHQLLCPAIIFIFSFCVSGYHLGLYKVFLRHLPIKIGMLFCASSTDS